MNIYRENILDHYKRPRHKGFKTQWPAAFREYNRSCGDDISLQVLLKDNKVVDILWQGQGCVLATAGVSILSEMVISKPTDEILSWDITELKKFLGIDILPQRQKCALIGLRAIQGAIKEQLV